MRDAAGGVAYYDIKSQGPSDKWLELFRNFRRPLDGYEEPSRHAKVAVLDTGIDRSMIQEGGFLERIGGERNFLHEGAGEFDGAGEGAEDASDEAPDRHGSHIVGLILNLAPWAHVYVARVAKNHTTPPSPNCVAKAIRYAVDTWNVHIISMSLGFDECHECIEDAVRFASDKGVIMFAAASNDGTNKPIHTRIPFPARMSEVICINSSDGSGNPSGFNPPPTEDGFNFLTLGESVPTVVAGSRLDGAKGPPRSRRTGTSFATPVAAAIAALLVEFLLQNPLRKDKALLKALLTRDGMTKVFAGMSDPVNGFRYLRPWELLCCKGVPEHKCSKTCRKEGGDKVKKLLGGPLPIPGGTASLAIPDLPHVPEAEFDSQLQEGKGQCLAGTRTDLLGEIRKWVDETRGQLVGFLTGRAGSGKSAIARTVALQLYSSRRLGASYFFTRNRQGCQDDFDLVTSIAYQLAKHQPRLAAKSIAAAIAGDPDLLRLEKARGVQWDKLVTTPLKSVTDTKTASTIIVVIDGLDECSQFETVLRLLRELEPLKSKVRVFLTSRANTQIEDAVRNWLPEPCRFDLDAESRSVSTFNDITQFIRQDLEPLRQKMSTHFLKDNSYLDDQVIIESLARRSAGLFIYAKTACRYIIGTGNQSIVVEQRLEQVLSGKQFDSLDGMYTEILEDATRGPDQEDVKKQLRQILELVVALIQPMPEHVYSQLCSMDPRLVKDRLGSLRPVLAVRETPEQPVQIFHETFRTYLVERAKKTDFGIDQATAHQNLFSRIMRLLLQSNQDRNPVLKADICNMGHPGVSIDNIDQQKVESCLLVESRYACRYWVDHLEQLDPDRRVAVGLRDNGQVHRLLENHLLHWVEALCLMRCVNDAIFSIRKLTRLLTVHVPIQATGKTTQLMSIAKDAQHFILYNRGVLEKQPLQLYASALVFSPARSLVRELFKHAMPKWIVGQPPPVMEDGWDSCLHVISSRGWVRQVAFAHDSPTLAIASSDGTVSIWDAATGERHYVLPHKFVEDVVFSPDSSLLASTSWMHLPTLKPEYYIKIWDTRTGCLVWALDGHTDWVTSVVFSSDSARLASASQDGTVRIWDLRSGNCEEDFREFRVNRESAKVTQVVFSHDSVSLIVVLDRGGGIKIWTSRLRQWELTFGWGPHDVNNNGSEVYIIAFSRGAREFASPGNSRGILDIWETSTGVRLHSLDHGSDSVGLAVFSNNGQMVASTSRYGYYHRYRIHIWDAAQGKRIWKLKNGREQKIIRVVFSPDSKLLASVEGDGITKVWDMETGKCRLEFGGRGTYVRSIAFSYDSSLLVSALGDRLNIWGLTSGQMQVGRSDGGGGGPTSSLSAFYLTSVLTSKLGRILKMGSDGSKDEESPRHLEPHEWPVTSLAFSHDAKTLVSTSRTDGTVKFFDVRKRECFETLRGNYPLLRTVFSHDRTLLALPSSYGSTIDIREASTCRRRMSLSGGVLLSPLAFSPSSKMLALTDLFRVARVKIWNMDRDTIASCEFNLNHVVDLVFSHDDRQAAIVSVDHIITIVNASTGKVSGRLAHGSPGTELGPLAYTPDSTRLASSSNDGTVWIWDVRNGGVCVCTLEVGGASAPRTMSFDPTGTRLITEAIVVHLREEGTTDSAPAALTASISAVPPARGYGVNLDTPSGAWITRDSKPWLWLPPDYRPTCWAVATPEASDVSMVAIGCESGRMFLFSLR